MTTITHEDNNMWVLLGSYEQEEDFGGFQIHKDIFLGVFDTEELAKKASGNYTLLKAGYSHLVFIPATINRLVSETGVDW